MTRSAVHRLRDILHSADLAARFAAELDAETLAAAAILRDATLFQIVVIGEAASQLPAEVQALAPEIPWWDIRGMRNIVVHGYWQIDFGIVVDVIANDLKPLKAAALRLIDMLERGASDS